MASENKIENDVSAQQDARAVLRENFLRTIHDLRGERCKIMSFELNWIDAKFANLNGNSTEAFFHFLETPACVTLNASVLRTKDILAIKFDKTARLP